MVKIVVRGPAVSVQRWNEQRKQNAGSMPSAAATTTRTRPRLIAQLVGDLGFGACGAYYVELLCENEALAWLYLAALAQPKEPPRKQIEARTTSHRRRSFAHAMFKPRVTSG